MSNAKKEFLEHTGDKPKVLCVNIARSVDWWDGKKLTTLRKDYSEQDFNEFLEKLNFEYYSGYGSQELFGVIWYEDGTWSERGEYDGSEWWEYRKAPEIPAHLIEVKP